MCKLLKERTELWSHSQSRNISQLSLLFQIPAQGSPVCGAERTHILCVCVFINKLLLRSEGSPPLSATI